MNVSEHFESAVERAFPSHSWANVHTVVAVSGGADSCALLAALAKLKAAGAGELFAAHFHHGLRGTAADADAKFVEEFGQSLGVRVIVGHGDVQRDAAEAGDGVEAAARMARYKFLREAAEQVGARLVATAHTQDDQVETILHRIVRGTGIRGLGGMRWDRALSESISLYRPLLALRRSDVLAYLAARGLSYRDDESNADLRFTRNRLRHELLPLLRASYNADVDGAILRLSQLAYECQFTVAAMAGVLAQKAVTYRSESMVVVNSAELTEPAYFVKEMFKLIWGQCHWPEQSMGYDEWNALYDLAKQWPDSGELRRTFPGSILATKKGEQLTLTRLG